MSEPLQKLPSNLKSFGTLLRPEESEPPILAVPVRQAVHQWMIEINAADELAEAGLKPRSSCILSGPPGCGKTTMAHHFAARLGLPLLCLHMDRLRSQYVGATGNNVAGLFEFLDTSPDGQIIFFDEFDAIASKRSNDDQASTREHNSIVDSLLARIESFKGIMIAATNRASAIDPAIWRRFGIHLEIALPGRDERFAIMRRYLLPYTLPDDDMGLLADATAGAPPSLLRQLMEGLKRDMILGQRLKLPTDAAATWARLRESCRPHESYETPAFWENGYHMDKINKMSWPPSREEKAA